jgi:hypothetical protein
MKACVEGKRGVLSGVGVPDYLSTTATSNMLYKTYIVDHFMRQSLEGALSCRVD